MSYTEGMFWLGEDPRLWAMLHQPVSMDGSPVEGGRAVVLCPPFAEEEKLSRRLYVELARELARRGVTALRFSYGGTADSEGIFSQFTMESARHDMERAVAYCRETLHCTHLATFGLRLGGTFALQALSLSSDVERVALWSPVTNGRNYVRMNFRRKAIRQMINTGTPVTTSVDPSPVQPGGGPSPIAEAPVDEIFDFDGYPVAQKLWNELEAMQSEAPTGWKGQALVVSVAPVARPSAECAALAEKLTGAGIDTNLQCVVAQPFWNLLGLVECPEIIELTAEWLAAHE
ncbi:MAG: hypothetical protein M3Y56_04390 [Armatimonadota bacterium]|nr:hypothetical protein [Armatimonadota bacterium]